MINLNREIVLSDYNSATLKNSELFGNGNIKATEEYIYPNQKEDAINICNKFYESETRVISIVKRTKIGMDGLMIELAKNITTHPDDNFTLHRDNVFFITAMSNKLWEDEMKNKMPGCFKDNVYHHGKLQKLKSKLVNIKNAIIINDEIDSGDKEDQKLHMLLKESGTLDIKYMNENNIRFVFVSATMINELHDLYKWGDIHYTYYMSIPEGYIGHKEFLELDIIKEYYKINDNINAEKWIQEDIIDNYADDHRVHIIRTDEKNKNYILNACIKYKIDFKNHTSSDRIEYKELFEIFNNFKNHTVIAVKGFYRRANLIPNEWKMRIGATHERYVNKYDTNVQVQGLPGRMTGYWKNKIINGHKTGPHRTSIQAINEYEEFYKNPFGKIKYSTSSSKRLLVNPINIKNLEILKEEGSVHTLHYRIYDNETITKDVCKRLRYGYITTKDNLKGFKETSLNRKKGVASLEEAISKVQTAYGTNNGNKTWRTYYPCYIDINNNETLRFVVIIRPTTDINILINEIDKLYPQ